MSWRVPFYSLLYPLIQTKETAPMILPEKTTSLRKSTEPQLPPGTNRCQCASCGHYFGGVRAFEKHRVRVGPAVDRACLDPGGVSDSHKQPLLRLTEQGYWVRIDWPVHLRQPVVRVAA